MTTKELLKKVRQIEIKTRGLVNQVFSGEYHSVFKGRGMEFAEVREYQAGDDIRNIDWNVTARFGHPFIKIFNEERELTIILAVDLSGSQYFGTKISTKQQIAAEVSAILAFSALKNNDKVGLLLFSDKIEKYIPPKKNKQHILRIIRELLSFQPTGKGTNLKASLEYLLKAIKKRSIVFLISDFNDNGYEKVIKSMARKHDFVSIILSDRREEVMPNIGMLELTDGETGERIVIDTSDKNFREWYAGNSFVFNKEIQQLFRVSKIDNINVRTGESYILPLVKFFKQRASRW